jgi:DNA polymerase-3 subunit gamma/tau
LVGQENIVRALTHSLDRGRLHHAFLFSGIRGIGKTTIARIFAKSLNCETGVSSTPCGKCNACREIDLGRFVDLIEVDAASRTKVEDTRALLENVQYSPSRGRFKVYLIDEVHMLSTHSFNALLKTLEEPPPHIKFLLATTEPKKLPLTILSRCLQFNLKPLKADVIEAYLERILIEEGVPCDDFKALNLIAQASDGSMRDALSLLDQAIAFGSGRVDQVTVTAMLGSVDQKCISGLLESLATNDAANLLRQVAELDKLAPDYTVLLAELLSLLQQVAIIQVLPALSTVRTGNKSEDLLRLANLIAPEDIQLFYQILLLGRRDLPLTIDLRSGFEMLLLRMLCFRPDPLDQRSYEVPRGVNDLSCHVTNCIPMETSTKIEVPSMCIESIATVTAPLHFQNDTQKGVDWALLIEKLGLGGMAKQLALNCVLVSQEDDNFHLILAPAHAQLLTKAIQERLRSSLEKHFGTPVKLRFQFSDLSTGTTPECQYNKKQKDWQQAITDFANKDPNMLAIQEIFDAKITAISPLEKKEE